MSARVLRVAAATSGYLSALVLLVMAGLSTVTTFTAAEWAISLAAAFAAGVLIVLGIVVVVPRSRPGWWWHR